VATYKGEWVRKLVLSRNHEVVQLLLAKKESEAKIHQQLTDVFGEIVVSCPHVTEWHRKCSANCENTATEAYINHVEEIIKMN
jgi:hypothetical protein